MNKTLLTLATLVAPLWLTSATLAQSQSANANPSRMRVHVPLDFTQTFSQSPTGYTPAQVRHAYGMDQLKADTGTGQTIAVIEAYGSPTVQKDLDTFSETFNLPKTTVTVYPPQNASAHHNLGWALETNLDVQWAHAIAPNAQIMVVVAKNDMLSSLLTAVDYAVQNGATQVSMSWGVREFASETQYDTHFDQPGTTFVSSSGDAGFGVQWPAASPNVISVGGTTLKLDSQGEVLSESGWTYSNGGTSAYEATPTWQSTWQSTNGRGVPDVSYVADPSTGVSVYISKFGKSSGWITLGGTSVGASQWAGIFALAASGHTGDPSSNSATEALYDTANRSYSSDFRDITTGSSAQYSATPSYDFVTGLGTPVSNELVPSLETE